jgi:hypothetical protein
LNSCFEKKETETEKKKTVHLTSKQLLRFDFENVINDYSGCPDEKGNLAYGGACIEMSEENKHNYKTYGSRGFKIVFKKLHDGLIEYYSKCKRFPERDLLTEILIQDNSCVTQEYTEFELELIKMFVKLVKENKISFYLKRLVEGKIGIFITTGNYEYEYGKISNLEDIRSLLKGVPDPTYLICNKSNCAFGYFSRDGQFKSNNERVYILSCGFGKSREICKIDEEDEKKYAEFVALKIKQDKRFQKSREIIDARGKKL